MFTTKTTFSSKHLGALSHTRCKAAPGCDANVFRPSQLSSPTRRPLHNTVFHCYFKAQFQDGDVPPQTGASLRVQSEIVSSAEKGSLLIPGNIWPLWRQSAKSQAQLLVLLLIFLFEHHRTKPTANHCHSPMLFLSAVLLACSFFPCVFFLYTPAAAIIWPFSNAQRTHTGHHSQPIQK